MRPRVRTLAYWTKDHIAGNIEFNLAGTPCEEVIAGRCATIRRVCKSDSRRTTA